MYSYFFVKKLLRRILNSIRCDIILFAILQLFSLEGLRRFVGHHVILSLAKQISDGK